MNADVVGEASSHTIPEAFNFGKFFVMHGL